MKINYAYSLLLFFSAVQVEAQHTVGGIDVENQLAINASAAIDCETIFSFPHSDSGAGGLTSDGTYLYAIATSENLIRKYDLTGQLVGTLPHPNPGSADGDLSFDGSNLLVLSEQSNTLYKISTTDGAIVSSFGLPPASNYDYFGCAYDNGFIWIAEYFDKKLVKINAETGELVASFNTPYYILPLELINGSLYGVEFENNSPAGPMHLVKFDKTTGAIIQSVPLCIPYCVGLAYADNHLWGVSGGYLIGTETIYGLNITLSTKDNTVSPAISLVPNPVLNSLNIITTETIDEVEIYNLVGAKVFSVNNVNQTAIDINLSNLSSGLYTIRVLSDNKFQASKFVKL
jgi:outer membrane protein assembly factor BamB